MTIDRRTLLQCAVYASWFASSCLQAQPAGRPIRIIVPASPGSSLDLMARYLSGPLREALGADVIVENKVGANGVIGADFVAKATPDGTTLLLTSVHHYLSKVVTEGALPYDPERDFTPVARLANGTNMVVVPASSPYKTLDDMVQDMKSRPGQVTFGSSGSGSTTHLCSALLNQMTHTQAKNIPYRGTAGATTDAVGGQVDFTCQSTSTALPLVKAGRLRALGQTGKRRLDGIPDIPTVAEAGVADYEAVFFLALLAPVSTPASIVNRLSATLVKIAGTPAFKEFCAMQQLAPDFADAPTFNAQIPGNVERWLRIAKASKQ